MRWFYCYESSGWFSPEYNNDIPTVAVEVDQDHRFELLAGIEAGFIVVKGLDGMPELAARPGPTADQIQKQERIWRDAQLESTDPLVMRHRDELELSEVSTLSADQYRQLQAYRDELRNWPGTSLFPASGHRPVLPFWLSEEFA